MNNLVYFLYTDERSLAQNGIRSFFGFIIKFVYKLFSGAIDLMYNLGTFDYQMDDLVQGISSKIFNLLIIFMIFKLSFSVLTYIVNVDTSMDSNKGFPGLIKRILISIILLVSINPIFLTLENLQNTILNDDIITSILSDTSNQRVFKAADDNLEFEISGLQMSPYCPSDKSIYTVSKGDRMALLLFRPFLQPYNENDINDNNAWNMVFGGNADEHKNTSTYYCGVADSDMDNQVYVIDSENGFGKESIKRQIPGPNSVEGFMMKYYTNVSIGEITTDDDFNGKGGDGNYFFEFNYIMALVAGILGLLIVITFCFDIVIRSFTLLFLQIIAPIPIISYVSPHGKSSEMLGTWGKKVATTWVSIFIRIATLSLGITFIDRICALLNSKSITDVTLMMQLFIILGILMFVKKLPQLIEELFPGLKLSGLKLNPFKRIREDAAGGNLLMDTAGRAVGMTTGLIGGGIAGAKAGREVGATGKGIFLGAASGISTGFKNKKWSFGNAMNESYKNLTGSEFRRLTPVSMLLPRMGAQPVQEAKDYIKDAYSQLNKLESDLNISESRSSTLAQDLATRGYNYNNIQEMTNDVISRINEAINVKNAITNNDKMQIEYNAAASNYGAVKNQYTNEINDLNTQIRDVGNKMKKANGTERDELSMRLGALSRQLRMKESDARNAIEQSRINMENAKTALDNSKVNMDKIISDYNVNNKTNVQNISDIENIVTGYNNDKNNIETYARNRANEDEIRSMISKVNKDIETLKKEKAQRERFYRIDPAPQQDYSEAKDHVDERKNNI